jgi:hypothetical protein
MEGRGAAGVEYSWYNFTIGLILPTQGKDLDVDSGCDEGTGRGTCGVLPSSQQMDQEMMAVEAAVAAAQLEADEPPPATAGELTLLTFATAVLFVSPLRLPLLLLPPLLLCVSSSIFLSLPRPPPSRWTRR